MKIFQMLEHSFIYLHPLAVESFRGTTGATAAYQKIFIYLLYAYTWCIYCIPYCIIDFRKENEFELRKNCELETKGERRK